MRRAILRKPRKKWQKKKALEKKKPIDKGKKAAGGGETI